jgi:serine/threonine protein phosphatase 1
MMTVAIGDIHGMYEELACLLDRIDAFLSLQASTEGTVLIFLGDYVDRGPRSREVVRRVRKLQCDHVICLRGNHEEMMSKYLNSPLDWQNFFVNGGEQTLLSYEGHDRELQDDREWMASLPTSWEDEMRIFVHAGIDPEKSLPEQSDKIKLWIKGNFLRYEGPFAKYVVHGHTVESTTAPAIHENRCSLDTGCVFGGGLSAAFFNKVDPKPFHTITVPARIAARPPSTTGNGILSKFIPTLFGK